MPQSRFPPSRRSLGRLTPLVLAAALLPALAACGESESVAPLGTPAPSGAGAGTATGAGTGASTAAATGAGAVTAPGVGGVAFERLGPERVRLGAVSPEPGWDHAVLQDGDDELLVVFRRGERRVHVDIEDDDGAVEAVACELLTVAGDRVSAPGVATMTLQREGLERLRVLDVVPEDGWEATVAIDRGDEVTAVLERDGRRVVLEVEEDDGALEASACERLAV